MKLSYVLKCYLERLGGWSTLLYSAIVILAIGGGINYLMSTNENAYTENVVEEIVSEEQSEMASVESEAVDGLTYNSRQESILVEEVVETSEVETGEVNSVQDLIMPEVSEIESVPETSSEPDIQSDSLGEIGAVELTEVVNDNLLVSVSDEEATMNNRLLTGVEALDKISDCLVTHSGSYAEWYTEPQNVFGQEHLNAFSIGTNSSYNMWGYGTAYIYLNTMSIDELDCYVGLADGGQDSVTVNIYENDREHASYSYDISATAIPEYLELDLSNTDSLKIEVINNSGEFNRTVFYDLQIE